MIKESHSEYSILFFNQECKESSLPLGVTYQNNVITFNNKEPLEFEIIYDLDDSNEFSIEYHFESNVEVHLIETHYLSNNTSLNKTIMIKENAKVSGFHQNLSNDSKNTHINTEVHIEENGQCLMGYAELNDGHINANYHYHLDGINASAKVRMAILSQLDQNKKYEVLIKHNQPMTYGQMDNYGVVKDKGHLTIDGIGTITKGQRGSASHQTNKIMVFDKDCYASANPYLYIDEYDVKASHAAGVGKMDEEHLYYLQTRGLTKKQAMQLITYGYLHPVIDVIDNDMIKEQFENVLSKVGA